MAQRSDASHRPGTLSASSKDLGLLSSTGKPVAGDSSPKDEASSSQVWQANAKTTSAGRTAAWRANQDTDLSTSTWKRVARDLEIVDIHSGWQKDDQISEASELYREEVFLSLTTDKHAGNSSREF